MAGVQYMRVCRVPSQVSSHLLIHAVQFCRCVSSVVCVRAGCPMYAGIGAGQDFDREGGKF